MNLCEAYRFIRVVWFCTPLLSMLKSDGFSKREAEEFVRMEELSSLSIITGVEKSNI